MNNEKQQLKARFFGMHIGCKFQYRASFDSVEETVMGIDVRFTPMQVISETGGCDIGKCKLILRPLSSITDQEAIEVASLLKWPIQPQYTNLAKDELGLFVENTIVADYLRSRNFCLPFNGFDPVDVGWAILETENQNPK